MTEKEKMLQGLVYNANFDDELLRERLACKKACQKYNNLPVEDPDGYRIVLAVILGKMGKNITIMPDFWCDYGWNIEVGDNFFANHGLIILDAAKVTFGDNVYIGPSCGFYTSGHPIDYESRNQGLEYAHRISVGNNVWIGAAVHVMPGVTIGDNSVIGGGSIVVKDVPSNVIAVGNPCKVIRELHD